MKHLSLILTVLIILTAAVLPCSAAIDPILLDEPNDAVFGCGNDIFIEFLSPPVITPSLGGTRADGNFLFFRIELLFLANDLWKGIDKASFSVKHTAPNGTEEVYPLDYAQTMITNLKQNLRLLSEPISLTSLYSYVLVFDVPSADRDGWSFEFRPTERGGEEAWCSISIPLRIQ